MGVLLVIVILLALWDPVWGVLGLPQMSPWRLLARFHEPDPPLLVEVRTPGEFRRGHIPGAVNLPFGSPETLQRVMDLNQRAVRPRDGGDEPRQVVVICLTGHRSPFAASRLRKQGVDAINLTWGMLGWKLAGGRTVRDA